MDDPTGTVERKPFLDTLAEGDRRSRGHVEEVIAQILAAPAQFGELVDAMLHPDLVIRSRAAHCADRITAQRPDLLQPHKQVLLEYIAEVEQWEVRAMVCRMLPRLHLDADDRKAALTIARGYLRDKSSIVRTFAMQALVDLAEADPELRDEVLPVIEKLTRTGTPAMRSRGRKLLKRLHP
ncbi:MAG: hypothetical protein ACE5G0_22350 [Rhodothermales bacterium]